MGNSFHSVCVVIAVFSPPHHTWCHGNMYVEAGIVRGCGCGGGSGGMCVWGGLLRWRLIV